MRISRTGLLPYSRDRLWDIFAGSRVTVTGERYRPEGRAIVGPHVRVQSLEVIEPKNEELVQMGPEVTLRGRLQDEEWRAKRSFSSWRAEPQRAR